MKFSLFNPWPVYGVPLKGEWPASPKLSDANATRQASHRAINISKLADEAGFDYITVAEHHYHPSQLSPNPLLSAAALSQHLTHAGVAVLGATLPLLNPIRTAEEVAMVDALTNGNMIIGFFRGTPNEFLTYGTNPSTTREVFEEQVSLILQAWTQPEPFAWAGRYFDYRMVSVWPRPVSSPHPSVLVSANSPTSAIYAARNRFKVGISFAPMDKTTQLVARFVEEAKTVGYAPQSEDILHRSFCCIAETDEKAEEIVERYKFGDMSHLFRAPYDFGITDALRAAIAAGESRVKGAAALAPIPGRERMATKGRPHFVGSPNTVARQIQQFSDQTGVGHFDLLFNDLVMDYDHACQGVRLFGAEVLPQLASTAVSV